MSYEIEKGVPIPEKKTSRPMWSKLRKVFTEMEVGDSFRYPIKTSLKGTRASVMLLRRKYRPEIKLRIEQTSEQECTVWRVA